MYLDEAIDIIYLSEEFSLSNIKDNITKMKDVFSSKNLDKIEAWVTSTPKHSLKSIENFVRSKSPEIIEQQKNEIKRFKGDDQELNKISSLIIAAISTTVDKIRGNPKMSRYADTLDALLHKLRNFLIRVGSGALPIAIIANLIVLIQPILIQYGAYILSPNLVGLAKAIAAYNVYIAAGLIIVFGTAFLLDYIIKKRREKRSGKKEE